MLDLTTIFIFNFSISFKSFRHRGYDKAVDWWALGTLLYEMAAGYPPFTADQPIQIYEKIVKGKVTFPSHFSAKLRGLLGKLLRVDPVKRYGSRGGNGPKEVRNHAWFVQTDWLAIYEKRVKPPFIPQCSKSPEEETYLRDFNKERIYVIIFKYP